MREEGPGSVGKPCTDVALVAGGLGALHLPDLRDGKEPLKKKRFTHRTRKRDPCP